MPKINTRAKGHAFERRLVKIFKDLGYADCVTSRLESKARDDAKVDLCKTGRWNVQAKAVESLGSTHKILDSMPKEKGQINLLFHKRNNLGVVVSLTEEDFLSLVKLLISKKLI